MEQRGIDLLKLARAREVHPGVILIEDGGLVRGEQLEVIRVALVALQGKANLVNRVLRIWPDGTMVFEDVSSQE